MDTSSTIATSQLETLISDLNLIDRFGDQMSRSELIDAVKTSSATLDSLLAEIEDPYLQGQASVASDELQKFLAFPDSYTDGLIVAVLMVTRSAIRRIATARAVSIPRVGAVATHRAGTLEPLEVTEVSEDGAHIKLLVGRDQPGAIWHRAENYEFS